MDTQSMRVKLANRVGIPVLLASLITMSLTAGWYPLWSAVALSWLGIAAFASWRGSAQFNEILITRRNWRGAEHQLSLASLSDVSLVRLWGFGGPPRIVLWLRDTDGNAMSFELWWWHNWRPLVRLLADHCLHEDAQTAVDDETRRRLTRFVG